MSRRLVKLISIVVLCISMAFTPIIAYAAPAQQTATVDASVVNTAITNKDYNTILKIFFGYYGNYFRAHGAEDNFKYFNAKKYLETYPDVAKAYNNDPKGAIEHYLAFGVYEGRNCCAQYDVVKFIKANPTTVLSPEFTNNIATPEKYFESVQPQIEAANKTGPGTTTGSGGSGGSGGGVTPSPSPTPVTTDKKTTTMLYFAGTDLEEDGNDMTKSLIDAALALYGTKNANVLATLGGAYSWGSQYLNNLLGNEDRNQKNTTGWFRLDAEQLTKQFDSISKSTGIPVSSMYGILHNESQDDTATKIKKELYNEMYKSLFNETTMPKLAEPSKTASMGSKDTLEKMLNIAKNDYKADYYTLEFSGHGGGCTGGVGSSSDGSSAISVADIGLALKQAGFGNSGSKLSFIAFDACLMGSVEIANVLKDYYSYMYGSEMAQRSDINYYKLIESSAKNANVSDFAKTIAYTVFTSRSAYKTTEGDIQTAAIFNSAEANNAVTALNNWATTVVAQLGDINGEKASKIFDALKKAQLRSFQVGGTDNKDNSFSYFDVQDYLEHFKAALNEYGIKTCDESIDAAIKAVDKFITANSYNFDGVVVYNSEQGGLIESSKALWNEYLHYNFCGGTIFFPSYGYTFSESGWNMEDPDKDWIDTLKKSYTDEYSSKYEGTGLSSLCGLMSMYMNKYLTKEEFQRIRNLATALITGGDSGNGTTYEKLVDVKLTDDTKAIKVTVANYDTVAKPEYSSGDPYLDIMDTAKAFTAYLTRKVSCIAPDGTTKKDIDLIISETTINFTNTDGTNNSVVVMPKEILGDTKINYAVGVNGSSKATKDDPLDLLIASWYDVDTNKKNLFLGLDKDYQDIIDKLKEAKNNLDTYNKELVDQDEKVKKAKNTYDREFEQLNKLNPGTTAYDDQKLEVDKAEKEWNEEKDKLDACEIKVKDSNNIVEACTKERDNYYDNYKEHENYRIYAGSVSYGDKDDGYNNVQLVFEKNGDDYKYCKAVSTTGGDDPTYSEILNVKGISFYHYYLAEGTNGADILKYVEFDTDNNTDNYKYNSDPDCEYKGYDTSKYYYEIGGSKTVVIKSGYIEYYDDNAMHNGWEITMTTTKDYMVDLNQKTVDGQPGHEPIHTDSYTGLITLAQANETGYVPDDQEKVTTTTETAEQIVEEENKVAVETEEKVVTEETEKTSEETKEEVTE